MNQSGTLVNAAPDVCREFAEPVNRNGDSPLAQVAQHEFELVQTMIELRFGDHQRRRQPDGRAIPMSWRVLVARPTPHDITTGAEARVDVNAGPQPAGADSDHAAADHVVQPLPQLKAQFGCAFLVVAGLEQPDHG